MQLLAKDENSEKYMPMQTAQLILDRRTRGKYVYYLIQWNSSDKKTSWEPLHNCNSFIHLIKQYNKRTNREKNAELMMKNRSKVQIIQSSSSSSKEQCEEYSSESESTVKKSKRSKKVTRVYKRKQRGRPPKKEESHQIVRERRTRESERRQKEQEEASRVPVRQPQLKIEKMHVKNGEFWCDVSSRNGHEKIKKAEVLYRNHMALIDFYEKRIRF